MVPVSGLGGAWRSGLMLINFRAASIWDRRGCGGVGVVREQSGCFVIVVNLGMGGVQIVEVWFGVKKVHIFIHIRRNRIIFVSMSGGGVGEGVVVSEEGRTVGGVRGQVVTVAAIRKG